MSSQLHSNQDASTSTTAVTGDQKSTESLVIVHVVTQFCLGGAENHVAQLAAAQVADGHKVTVIGLWPGQVFPQKFAEGLRESRVEYAVVGSANRFLYPLAIVRLGSLLRSRKPDVVHSHLPAACIATGWWNRRSSRNRRSRFVTTIHGWENRQSCGWRRRLIGWGLKHHDDVIAVSHWLSRQSADFGISPDAIHVVHHGIRQPSVNSLNRRAIRASIEAHFNSPDVQIIGSIARQTEKKGLEVLIGAVPYMDSRSVVVIIGAEADSTPSLRRMVAELNIEQRCWFAGTTSDPADWMAAFDFFCLPSHLEGFGLVFLEAGFIGIPVVGTDVPATNEIIRNGVDGILVPDGDSASLATAIRQLLGSPVLARSFVDTFRTRVEADFSFGAMVEAIYDIYLRNATDISRAAIHGPMHEWKLVNYKP